MYLNKQKCIYKTMRQIPFRVDAWQDATLDQLTFQNTFEDATLDQLTF